MANKNKVNCEKLFDAILSLKTKEECAAFFEDICTYQEIEALVQRLDVACLLEEGKSYVDINKLTGASTATICRVSKSLNYGEGGYFTVIERLGK
jgi:TrpR-related protein YerC/YecD